MPVRASSRVGLGVIGFGAFGRFLADHLGPYFEVVVTDRCDRSELAASRGSKWGSLGEVADQRLVILAVPVQELESLLREISPRLRPGTLVVDVSSVKVKPAALMSRLLPVGVHRDRRGKGPFGAGKKHAGQQQSQQPGRRAATHRGPGIRRTSSSGSGHRQQTAPPPAGLRPSGFRPGAESAPRPFP